MRFSLVSDWYFCNCIESRPSATSSFLGILEILDNDESSEQLLLLALGELKKMDSFMSIYSLPQVLTAYHHPNLLNENAGVFKEYFAGLCKSLNPTLEILFTDLFAAFINEQDPNQERFSRLIRNCADQVLSYSSDDKAKYYPYLELKDFLPEVILLSVIDNYCSQKSFNPANFPLLKNNIPLQMVLQNALDLKYGRLTFRLALRIMALCGLEKQDTLLSYIWENDHLSPAVSPDLILSTLEIIFFNDLSSGAVNSRQIVDRCRVELLELTWYRKLIALKTIEEQVKISRLKKSGKRRLTDKFFTFSLVYWQTILWDLCAAVAPEETFVWLSEIWNEPVLFYKESDSFASARFQKDQTETQEIRNLHFRITFLRRTRFFSRYKFQGKKRQFPTAIEQFIFSPWLEHSRMTEEGTDTYPMAKSPEVLIRLVAACFTASRLLQKNTPGDGQIVAARRNLASLLVHGYDVLDIFRSWLEKYKNPFTDTPIKKGEEKNNELYDLKLTSLAIFGRRQIDTVGSGKLKSIQPELFFAILNDVRSKENSGNYFYSTAVPETFFSWIANYRLNVTDSSAPGNKWLSRELVEDIYFAFRQNLHREKDVRNAALVARFIGKINDLGLSEKFDWRSRENEDKFPHRLYLLTDYNLSPTSWTKEIQKEVEIGSHAAVAKAVERVASLSNTTLPDQEGLSEKWLGNLAFHLEKYGQRRDIDRFVRLRLLELLDLPLIQDSVHVQELIMMILIESGSTFEIKELFTRLFPGVGTFSFNVSQLEIQALLLKVAKQFVDRDSNDSFRQIRDPYSILISYEKTKILRKMLAVAVFQCVSSLNDETASADDRSNPLYLYKNLLEYNDKQEKGMTCGFLKTFQTEAELSDANSILIRIDKAGDSFNPLNLHSVFFNPNNLNLLVNYYHFSLKNILCFFDGRTDLNDLTSRKYDVAGLFVNKIEGTSAESDEYLFDIGLPEMIRCTTSNRDFNIDVGTFVKLPLDYRGTENGTAVFEHSEDLLSKIAPLRSALTPGELRSFRVDRYPVENPDSPVKNRLVITEENSLSQLSVSDDFNLSDWEPNIVRNFLDNTGNSFTAVAQLSLDNKWVPKTGSFSDLLLKMYSEKTESIILTLIKPVILQDGQKAWIFAKNVGESFLIYDYEFSTEALEALNSNVLDFQSQDRSSEGLIVVFKPVLNEEKACLDLHTWPLSGEHLQPFYANLQTPFDPRNIDWRYFVENGEIIYIYKDNGEWFFYPDENEQISGFPEQIKIEWIEKKPDPSIEMLEIPVESWNYNKAIIRANYVENKSLNLLSGKEKEFVDSVLNLRKDDYIELSPIQEKFNQWDRGFLRCKTKENIEVRLEVESLTMQPLIQGETLAFPAKTAIVEFVQYYEEHNLNLKPDEVPSIVKETNISTGILYRVPVSTSDRTYEVLWKTRDGVKMYPLEIRIPAGTKAQKLSPGYKVIIEKISGGWSLKIMSLYVHARALWPSAPYEEEKYADKSLTHLESNVRTGEFSRNRKGNGKVFEETFFEYPQGQLVRFGKELDTYANHLATYENGGVKNVLDLNEQAFVASTTSGGHICLRIGNRYISGEFDRNISEEFERGDKVTINSIDIKPLYHNDLDRFQLRRVFSLRKVKQVKESRYSDEEIVEMSAILRECLEQKLEIRAYIDRKKNVANLITDLQNRRIRIPRDNDTWINWVRLDPNETPYMIENNYEGEGRVQLFKTPSGKIMASYRQVLPITLTEELRETLRARYNDNFKLNDNKLLYYVGPEKPAGTFNLDQTLHRFEFGYGRTALLPTSSLLYKGKGFEQVNLLLFSGDKITKIKFLEGTSNHQENNPLLPDSCSMSIEAIEPVFSNIRSIYEQRKKDIVHLLHVTAKMDKNRARIRINSVEGFDEFDITSNKPAIFTITKTKLSPESEEKLLDRIPDWEIHDGKSFKIYGRFDKELFEKSGGRDAFFQHVHLSFNKAFGAEALREREYLLLSVKNIKRTANERILILMPDPDIFPDGMGADFKEGARMIRRKFSVREEILRRIDSSEKERGRLIDKLLLVKVMPSYGGKKYPEASLIDTPSRKISSLQGKLMYQGSIFATVARFSDGVLRIEVSPGIYVNLDIDSVDNRELGRFSRGSVVEITLRNRYEPGSFSGKNFLFHLRIAAHSNSRYIRSNTRAAVVMPLPSLARPKMPLVNDLINQKEFWLESGQFNIGGMPSQIAKAAHYEQSPYQNSVWKEPEPLEMLSLMRSPHPKLARVGNNRSQFLMSPLEDNFPVGFLSMDNDAIEVKIGSFADRIPVGLSNTAWRYLTFAQISASDLMNTLRTENWNYLDSATGMWKGNDGIKEETQDLPLENHTVFTGPLFFERRNERLNLRYSPDKFFEFGFPASELAESLLRKPEKRGKFFVAGTEIDRAKGIVYNIWVELIPGRLVEIPNNIIRLPIQNEKDRAEIRINWQSFAPGDQVKISLLQSDSLTVEQFVLEDWWPGIRKVLGPQKALLPVISYDPDKGSLVLGAGTWKTVFPEDQLRQDTEFCLLTNDNDLHPFDKNDNRGLELGDVFFLTLVDDQLIPLGLEGWALAIDTNGEAEWLSSNLAQRILDFSHNHLAIDRANLNSLLQALEGALPVTVEQIDKTDKIIYFSLRHQVDSMPHNNSISLAKIEGLLGNEKSVLLRSGGQLIFMPAPGLVIGLPRTILKEVIEGLKLSNTLFWLSPRENENFSVGLDKNDEDEFMVKGITTIKLEGKEFGVTVQSLITMKFYWLPGNQIAWTTLEYAHLSSLIINKTFRVKKLKNKSVSILALSNVKETFDKLKTGDELVVNIIDELPSVDERKHQYLVESFNPKVAFTCESTHKLNRFEAKIVQVWKQFSAEKRIIVVPAGEIPLKLDLPMWMWSEDNLEAKISRQNIEGTRLYSDSKLLLDDSKINGLSPESVTAAVSWIVNNFGKAELNLYLALSSFLIINHWFSLLDIKDGFSQNEKRAIPEEALTWSNRLLTQIGKRAIRGRHVEILHFTLLKENIADSGKLQLRFLELLKKKTDENYSLLSSDVNDIKRFCDAVNLRITDESDIFKISAALQAALGETSEIVVAYRTIIIDRLIHIYRAYLLSKKDFDELVDKSLLDLIIELHRKLFVSPGGIDFTLLNPIEIAVA